MTDELLGGDGRVSGLISGRILAGDRDLSIIEREDATIADGNSKDVRREVFEGGQAGAGGLRVDDPIIEPDLRFSEIEEVGLFDDVAELGAVEDREGLDVDEEIGTGVEPVTIG